MSKFEGIIFLKNKNCVSKTTEKNRFVKILLKSSQLLKYTIEVVEAKVLIQPEKTKAPLKQFGVITKL